MTLGTRTDAALALSFKHDINQYWIGEGGTRSVYLINGIAYKVPKNDWTNQRELTIYDCLDTTNWPEWLKVPRMTGYSIGDRIVIAAEFVPGIPSMWCEECSVDNHDFCGAQECIGKYRRDVVLGLMFTDAECYGNTVQHPDGSLYIVDLPD